MKRHAFWLATGLILFVVLACKIGNIKNANQSNSSNATSGSESHGYIKEIHLARDDGNGAPGEETNTFSPGDRTVHCVAILKEAKSGTKMKFSWWIVDADGSQNEKIKEINYSTKALENIVRGHLTLPQDWPKGKYKVEVYVNDGLDRTVSYTVE